MSLDCFCFYLLSVHFIFLRNRCFIWPLKVVWIDYFKILNIIKAPWQHLPLILGFPQIYFTDIYNCYNFNFLFAFFFFFLNANTIIILNMMALTFNSKSPWANPIVVEQQVFHAVPSDALNCALTDGSVSVRFPRLLAKREETYGERGCQD